MTEQDKIDSIISLLAHAKMSMSYNQWRESVRGWGIYFSNRYNSFDVNTFYKAVGY